MIANDQFTLHGALDFIREPAKITLRPNGLDTVSQLFAAQNPRAFARGGRFPHLPNFYITESEPTIDIEGVSCDIRVRGEGLADGEDREEENEITMTDEGWDAGPMTWLTMHPERYNRGSQHPHIPTLWLLETQKKRIAGPRGSMEGIWRVSGDHKGILLTTEGLPKGRKRVITVANQVISSSDLITLTNAGYDGAGDPFPFWNKATGTWTGWSPGRNTALDSSRVQVSDTFITWDKPPTDQLPGHLEPPDAPLVKDIFGVPWFTSSGLVWNWPWGWSLKSINSTPLIYGVVGTPYLTTIVTEFVPRAVLK